MNREIRTNILVISTIFSIAVGIILICYCCWFANIKMKVKDAKATGTANLERQQQENLILISKAKAELAASKYQKQAIEKVGKVATKYPAYREQEFISDFGQAIKSNTIQKIYFVPTETNIPLIKTIK